MGQFVKHKHTLWRGQWRCLHAQCMCDGRSVWNREIMFELEREREKERCRCAPGLSQVAYRTNG